MQQSHCLFAIDKLLVWYWPRVQHWPVQWIRALQDVSHPVHEEYLHEGKSNRMWTRGRRTVSVTECGHLQFSVIGADFKKWQDCAYKLWIAISQWCWLHACTVRPWWLLALSKWLLNCTVSVYGLFINWSLFNSVFEELFYLQFDT